MQSQISNIMNDLVQNPSEAMPYQVQAMSQRRWLIEADPGPIVQLELLDDGRVTAYKRVSLASATAPGVFRQMMEFLQIASAVLAKRGIGLPGVISADDRDVA